MCDVRDIQFCLTGETVALAGEKLPWRRVEVFADDFNDSVLLGCGAGMLWCYLAGSKKPDERPILLLGFGSLTQEHLREGVKILEKCIIYSTDD